jgi:nucleotide-binding universal stress UspA family protein
MFHKILVPLDGSELAERALEPALVLAQQANSEIILLNVPVLEKMLVPTPAGYGLLLPEQSIELSCIEARNYLENIRQNWAYPNIKMSLRVVEGDEASVIADTAASEGVDLIVMSTHGRTGLSRWVLGSVTERVLHSASCPVLVIRSADPLSRVLITLDGSELAQTALQPGLEVAQRLGSQVTILRVVPDLEFDPADMAYLDEIEVGLAHRLRDIVEEESERYLDKVAESHSPDLNIQTSLWIGPPAQSILDFADLHDTNLIVMATHGRTGLRRWVYGSVTEKVLRAAKCSMLVVPPPWANRRSELFEERQRVKSDA